nr:MAG TPA: hypothetical protein [Caudoviricetes sp.]
MSCRHERGAPPRLSSGDCQWVTDDGWAAPDVQLFDRWSADDLLAVAQTLSDAEFWLEGVALREVEQAWQQSPDATDLEPALRGDAPPAPVPVRFRVYNPIPIVKALGAEGAEHAVLTAVTGGRTPAVRGGCRPAVSTTG